MAIPTYQASGSAAAGTGSVTPTWPAHAIGDIALCIVETTSGETATLSTPNGFALIGYYDSPAALGTRITVFWCRSTTTNLQLDPVVADAGDHVIAKIHTVRGCVATGDPWNLVTGGSIPANSATVSIPGATTTATDCLIVIIPSHGRDSAFGQFANFVNASLTSVTERIESGSTQGNGGGFTFVDGGLAVPGTFGTTTADALLEGAAGQAWMVLALMSTTSVVPVVLSPPLIGDWQYVVQIEGIPYVSTDGDPAAALAAYSGEGYAEALGGLVVDLEVMTEIHPHDPFKGGGTCTLTWWPDPTNASPNRFCIDTHRRTAGAETSMRVTADRDDGAIDVKRTDDFDAAPAEAYIGNECFGYSATPDTNTFTTSSAERGKYAPFRRNHAELNFAQHHRVGAVDTYGVAIAPVVTQQPRSWKGRWIAVRRHSVVNGVLCDIEDAKVDFAGTIGQVARGDRGSTVVQVEHVLKRIRTATVGREMWAGLVNDGFFLVAGKEFHLRDTSAGLASNGITLTVVASGATAPYEINEDYYTVDQWCSIASAWAAQGLTDGDIFGNYSFSLSYPSVGPRVKLEWHNEQGSAANVDWKLDVPSGLATFLGLTTGTSLTNDGGTIVGDIGISDTDNTWTAPGEPYRSTLGHGESPTEMQLDITEHRGTFQNQLALFPAEAGGPGIDIATGNNGYPWGLFLVNGQSLIAAGYTVDGDDVVTLRKVIAIDGIGGDSFAGPDFDLVGNLISQGPMEIRQVFYLAGSVGQLLRYFFYSTGTLDYNHATFDKLGYGLGLAIPHDLLGTPFLESIASLPSVDNAALVVIDKTEKFAEVFSVDGILRRCHLTFNAGHLVFTSWSTPAASLSTVDFTEINKAEPAGETDGKASHFAVEIDSDEFAKPIVKMRYNRSIKDGTYRSVHILEDATAIDDLGGSAEAMTLDARNVYDASVTDLIAEFLPWFAYWSRPCKVVKRSINIALYETAVAGALGTFSDDTVCDPATGMPGVSIRPCLVLRSSKKLGTKPQLTGSVTLIFMARDRTGVYCPSALLDGANYVAGTKTMTVEDYEYNNTPPPLTFGILDGDRFNNGDAIEVIEADPPDPAAPLVYQRNIVTSTAGVIVHDGAALGAGGGETAFDAAKDYIIRSRTYTNAVTAQKAKCYQADDADGMIANLAPPYEYANYLPSPTYDAGAHTELPERYSQASYGDGVALDVGHERGLVRMANNLYDHKTAVQHPVFDVTSRETSGGALTTDYKLLFMIPVFLGSGTYPSYIERYVYIAPHFAAKVGSANCRVTLCRQRVVASSLFNITVPDSGNSQSHVFVSASPIMATPTAVGFNLRVPTPPTPPHSQAHGGLAWILVEGDDQCQVAGLGELVVRERVSTL